PATPRAACSTLVPYTTLFRSETDLLGTEPAGVHAPPQMVGEQNPPVQFHRHVGQLGLGQLESADGPAELLPRLRVVDGRLEAAADRKSTRLNSSHVKISYAVF